VTPSQGGAPVLATLTLPVMPPPAVPTATLSLNASYGTNHQVTLWGRVNDANPASLVVSFTGAATGQAITDATGNYTPTFNLAALGSVTASVVGSLGGPSALASIVLSNIAPSIFNFTVSEGAPNIWTISGQVLDEHAAGLIVTLNGSQPGLQGATATVDATG